MKTLGQSSRFTGIALTALVGSLFCGGTSFADPIFVGNVCCIGSTIKTYDYSTGNLIASFTPDHDFNGRGVEVIGNTVYYTGSGERGPGAPDLHDIYLAPFNGGLGGHDTGVFTSPRPEFGIQDLDYSNGILYSLTGYFSGPPIVYALDPTDGHVIGTPVAINGPTTGADGFTVLPNGDFLINDTDGSRVYRGYDPVSGNPTGLVINTIDCCGVRYNAVDNLLYYSRGTRTTLTGTSVASTIFVGAGFEDITVLNAVPEPSSLSMMLCGSSVIAGLMRRRRHLRKEKKEKVSGTVSL